MLNKGLCLNCKNERSCIFAKKFPVLECEEFSEGETENIISKKKRAFSKV